MYIYLSNCNYVSTKKIFWYTTVEYFSSEANDGEESDWSVTRTKRISDVRTRDSKVCV